ncbi:MAG: HEAT repeat domain-containing protein [Acidimicrobiales bacterium]
MASGRDLAVERDLVRAAFEHLTVDAFMALPFEALGPTKRLLKRYFSREPWTATDEESLAEVVGPGHGWWCRDLDADVSLEYGWVDGRFGVNAVSKLAEPGDVPADDSPGDDSPDDAPPVPSDDPLVVSFDGPVVPEATPNPRTVRFQVGPIHDGPSRWYVVPSEPERSGGETRDESAASVADEPGVSRLFAEFTEVANVLVGPEFVAVGLRRADDWERLLLPVLAVVTEEFAPFESVTIGGVAPRVMGGPAGAGAVAGSVPERNAGSVPERNAGSVPERNAGGATGRRVSRLERAWRDLGLLRPAEAVDLDRVLAAAHDDDPSRRQVAANLLREADADVAAAEWARLIADAVRSVRRAAADAMVDVNRQGLRPLLEAALSDSDSWVRWKVLRGLAQLGAGASRKAIAAHADDADFRVRLEAASVLRSIG